MGGRGRHLRPSPASKTLQKTRRAAAAEELTPPFSLADTTAIASGQNAYQYYCIHCHGKYFDGYGTVGQSFAPPPGDLRSNLVQSMPEKLKNQGRRLVSIRTSRGAAVKVAAPYYSRKKKKSKRRKKKKK